MYIMTAHGIYFDFSRTGSETLVATSAPPSKHCVKLQWPNHWSQIEGVFVTC